MRTTYRRSLRTRLHPTKLGSLRIDSSEWHRAWELLTRTTLDADPLAEDPRTGEVWQYMVSVRRDGESRWAHEFRHRRHPKTGRKWIVLIPASSTWGPGDMFELPQAA